MRSLLNIFKEGKGGAQNAAQDLLRDLNEGEHVSREVWDVCRSSADLEEVLAEEISRGTLSALASTRPQCVFSLVQLCLESIEEVLPKQDIQEEDELSLANAMIVLTRILAAGPGGQPPEAAAASDSIPECTPLEAQFPLTRLLWEQRPATAAIVIDDDVTGHSVAERIIDAAMRSLFLEGFTIDHIDNVEDGKAGVVEQKREIVDGIDVDSLWYDCVGPTKADDKDEDAGQSEPNDDVRENRCLALQLLLAALCEGAPFVILKEEGEEEAKEGSKPPARGRRAAKETAEKVAERAAEEARLADILSRKQLISDSRFLAYLQDPERSVPWRGELLFSLLGLVLDYDPKGIGIPYAGFFSGNKQENFVSLGLQVLGLLLHACEGAPIGASLESAVVIWRPQELLGSDTTHLRQQGSNVFQSFLAKIASEREVEFISGGCATLFQMVGEDRRSYLPGSTKLPCFLSELLVLVYHLSGCRDFVRGLCLYAKEDDMDAAQLADSVLQLCLEGVPDHVRKDDAIFVGMATLTRLTAYREFCDKLNENYDGETPDDLPDFTGSFFDLIALAALKQINDKLNTAQVNHLHRSIVEVALCTLCNVSVFAEGLCTETCHRLFKLFECCGKVQVLRKGRNSIGVLLPRLLETFQNIVQYQYVPNADMIYGLMTREVFLRDLLALCLEKRDEASNGQHTSNDDAAAAFPLEWWAEVEARLRPVEVLLDTIVPILTAEVEKHGVLSPNDAKKFMPRTALGLLPVPHAFQLRSISGNSVQHLACERCLVACVAHGPSGVLWEEDEEGEDEDPKAEPSEAAAASGVDISALMKAAPPASPAAGYPPAAAVDVAASPASPIAAPAAPIEPSLHPAAAAAPVPDRSDPLEGVAAVGDDDDDFGA